MYLRETTKAKNRIKNSRNNIENNKNWKVIK